MKKIVLIGAGSSVFGLGTVSDIFKSTVLEGSTIVLHDINSKNLSKTKEIAENYRDKLNYNYNIEGIGTAVTKKMFLNNGYKYLLYENNIGWTDNLGYFGKSFWKKNNRFVFLANFFISSFCEFRIRSLLSWKLIFFDSLPILLGKILSYTNPVNFFSVIFKFNYIFL